MFVEVTRNDNNTTETYIYIYIYIYIYFFFFFFGGGSSKKIYCFKGGPVKKIGKLRGVIQFLNGASRNPPAPLPRKK